MAQKHIQSSLFLFILLCLAVEIFASYWTNQTVSTWYLELKKPPWNPPNWFFFPVWTILYMVIAISGWLIYKAEPSHQRSITLSFYEGQLALNFIWSFFFFP